MSRLLAPCLCCFENWPEDALTSVADGQLCPHCKQHVSALVKENATLRARITELEEQAEFQRRLRAGA